MIATYLEYKRICDENWKNHGDTNHRNSQWNKDFAIKLFKKLNFE